MGSYGELTGRPHVWCGMWSPVCGIPGILSEDITDLRLELEVQRYTVKTKHVVVYLRKLNSGTGKKRSVSEESGKIKYVQTHREGGQR